MHDNNCVDNVDCVDNDIFRMYFLCQDSIKKTFKNQKIFRSTCENYKSKKTISATQKYLDFI